MEIALARIVRTLKKMNQRDRNLSKKSLNETPKRFIRRRPQFKKLRKVRKGALAERVVVRKSIVNVIKVKLLALIFASAQAVTIINLILSTLHLRRFLTSFLTLKGTD